jgi:hypothetical protein
MALPNQVVSAVPAARTGSATAVNTVLRSAGGALGSTANLSRPRRKPRPGAENITIETISVAAAQILTIKCKDAQIILIVVLAEPGHR